MNVTQRYRWLYKPVVFILALLPAARLLAGAFGFAGISLGPDPVDELLHRCGKTALQLLFITLAVRPLSRLGRLHNLMRLRRMLGLFAFFYACLHLLVYVWLDQSLDLRTVGEDILKRPYITIGMLALIMLVPLAVTSTNGWMRRLGRRWQKLHRLIYPIAILGTWHFWWQVKADTREPMLYAFVLAVLLGWRILRARPSPATARGRNSGPAP